MKLSDYKTLYIQNKNFKNLFNANLISLFGDWFNFIAITSILLSLSDDSSIVAYMFIIHLLPYVFFTTSGGVLADKMSRRKIMMVSDIARAIIVGAILIAVFLKSVAAILVLLFLEYTFAAFFEPSRSAIVPNLVAKKDLYTANAALSTVWSLMMAFGMALGGLVVYLFNAEVALIIDAFTYVLSFIYIKKIRVEETHILPGFTLKLKELFNFKEVKEAILYIRNNVYLLPIVLSKGALEIYVGAFIFLLTLYGEQKFLVLGSGALGMGLLQTMRGIGTGIGPILSRRIFKTTLGDYYSLWMGLLIAPIGYFFLSLTDSFLLALLCVLIAHIGGSANWVTSEQLIHQLVPDGFRGRVVSFEFVFLTLTMSLSVKYGAILIETYHYSLEYSTQIMSYVGVITAIGWAFLTVSVAKPFKRFIKTI